MSHVFEVIHGNADMVIVIAAGVVIANIAGAVIGVVAGGVIAFFGAMFGAYS